MFYNGKIATVLLLSLLLASSTLSNASNSATPKEKTIYSFASPAPGGAAPNGGFSADAAGNLYGTSEGGAFDQGAVFKLRANSYGTWTKVILYSFRGERDGAGPKGPLVFDSAGNIYGTTFGGGISCIFSGCGTVFELSPHANGTWTEKILYRFTDGSDGRFPTNGVVIDGGGNLYGTSNIVAFRLSSAANGKWGFSIVHNFTGENGDGGAPNGLVRDPAGNLYGTTQAGGYGCTAGGCGMAFELSPNSDGGWTETFLHEFTGGSDGSFPDNTLIFDSAGNLYGTSYYGGTGCHDGCGTIFKLTRGTGGQWSESVLYSPQGDTDGSTPVGELVFDQAGNLFGATLGGGTGTCIDSCGVVYELSPAGKNNWQESVVWRFTGGNDGGEPTSGLMLDAAGHLLGETYTGGPNGNGVVYELSPSSGGTWQLSTLVTFPSGHDGDLPSGKLVMDGSGNLYGTAISGGIYGFGIAFELSPIAGGGWKETILYNFDIRQGRELDAISGLVFDTSGNLYGETYSGGASGAGIIFELSPSVGGAWTEKNLYVFSGGADGRYPQGGLVTDAAGNLYGAATHGGAAGDGIVFKLSPNGKGGWTESVIHNFIGYPTDGDKPLGGVTFDQAGNLLGTTTQGGSSGCIGTPACGTIYKLTPGSNGQWSETILHSFAGGSSDGGLPISTPIFDGKGNLFGTTEYGGGMDGCDLHGCGTAYEMSPSGGAWTLTVLHVFPDYTYDGYEPSGSPVLDSAGNLFGTTTAGGVVGTCLGVSAFCGTIFELTPVAGGGWTETVVHSFGTYNGDGVYPNGLIMDSAGNMYGVRRGGGDRRRL